MTSNYLTLPRRPFHIALAHVAGNLPLSEQSHWARINRIVSIMLPAARLAFIAELREVRAAKRGKRPGVVAS